MHRYDALWEIHKVHHSSRVLDWLATFRSHIVEQISRRLLAPLMLIFLGVSPNVVALAAGVFYAWAMLIHSNLNLNLRAIEPLLVTPRLHRLHHDSNATNRNLGTVFTIWDRLLGKFDVRDVAPDVIFGVPAEVHTYPQGWWRQFLAPLRFKISNST
jgi:sterol desaturase/sphingolipid hydroxylase (fatty acid hydroxylase superfamily)